MQVLTCVVACWCAAVQQLEKDAEHAATYTLLKIFAEEQTKAYTQFASANAAYLKKQGAAVAFV